MENNKKAWILSVDMGYGHQRAAYPLRDIAEEGIITSNTDYVDSKRERMLWKVTQSGYEGVSRIKSVPFIGQKIFEIYDHLQEIGPFFPFRVDSRSNGNVRFLKTMIKNGLCRNLMHHISQKNLPVVSTHFIPALACDYNNVKNSYCVITDTDVNRVWVRDNPQETNLTYLTPSRHAATRLLKYGVPEERIIFTGFPLPNANIGGIEKPIMKRDLIRRIIKLDPKRKFINLYRDILEKNLGSIDEKVERPITLCYMVGGAGAQSEIGANIIESLREPIEKGIIRIILVAGIREDVKNNFEKVVERLNLKKDLHVVIIHEKTKDKYFESFGKYLHEVDLIWTKPSEMSFYAALGIPIIIAPPVGAHEEFNQKWLQHMGAGFIQENPEYVNDWLFYVLETGRYAEAAWDGFVHAPSLGTYAIEEVVSGNAKLSSCTIKTNTIKTYY